MKIERLSENIHPEATNSVRLKVTGNIYEIRFSINETGGKIRKLDKDSYVDTNSGEIKEFCHSENRADNKASVAQSLKHLRDIINTNVTEPENCKWVTLTYRENMNDPQRLYDDFRKFSSRMSYYLDKNYLPKYEYIVAMEPQNRGAWHAHMIMIFNGKAPFISNSTLANIWGHGFVTIKSISNIDNVGLYLTAYLGDMDLQDSIRDNKAIRGSVKEVESIDACGNKSKKYYIKGARLKMYPAGFRMFRKSKGIKEPKIIPCIEAEALAKIGSAKLFYEKTVRLYDGDRTCNIINYRQFNKVTKL